MQNGKIYLIPTPLSEIELSYVMPEQNLEIVRGLTHFIAEDAKTARSFLKKCNYSVIQNASIVLLNEHTNNTEAQAYLQPALEGKNIGLMSDAGCPGIADPGASVVKLAHNKGIKVIPLVGPSSILLTAMASGFNGQNFAFVGYLPIEKPYRGKRIKELEQLSKNFNQAQYFIETPYRNISLMNELLATLSAGTLVCLGINLTAPNQVVISKTVSEWKNGDIPNLHKIPVVFGIYFKN